MGFGMFITCNQFTLAKGFTRMDAFMVTFSVVLLAAIVYAGSWIGGEKRRIWVCAHHLQTLGRAFDDYSRDHDGALPAALIDNGTKSTSWDREIAGYLNAKWIKGQAPESQPALAAKIAPIFKCPSDRELHGNANARSYSMTAYDLNRAGWPPKADSTGGLGLSLDERTIAQARAIDAAESPDYRPAIKFSQVTAPDDTALLVEHISILNALWSSKLASIASSHEQFAGKTFAAKDFHGGKMNYLMADGHVELMSPAESAGLMGGVWTIRKGD